MPDITENNDNEAQRSMSTLVYFNDCPEKMASKILDVLIGFMTIMIISL